jgi:hypothetical protein
MNVEFLPPKGLSWIKGNVLEPYGFFSFFFQGKLSENVKKTAPMQCGDHWLVCSSHIFETDTVILLFKATTLGRDLLNLLTHIYVLSLLPSYT